MVVLLTVFVNMLGVGLLIPLLPVYFTDVSSPLYVLPPDFPAQLRYLLFGALLGVFPLCQFMAAPVLGALSDRVGRRPVLLWSLLGTVVGFLTFAVALRQGWVGVMFLARAFDGLTSGNVGVSQSVLSDLTRPEQRTTVFGVLGAAVGAGFVLGPPLGGLLSDASLSPFFSAETPFVFGAGVTLLTLTGVWLALPETRPPRKNKPPRALPSVWTSFRLTGRALTRSPLRRVYQLDLLWQAGFAFFTTFFGVWLIEQFGATQTQIGLFFGWVGVCIFFSQGVLTYLVARHYAERPVLRLTLPLVAVGIVVHLWMPSLWAVGVLTGFFAVGVGLAASNLPGLLSRSAPDAAQGEVLGVHNGLQALGIAVPSFAGGVLASGGDATVPMLVGAGLVGMAAVWAWRE